MITPPPNYADIENDKISDNPPSYTNESKNLVV